MDQVQENTGMVPFEVSADTGYWSEENLPRLRDAIDLALSDLRNTMRAPEEAWVDDPALAWWKQDNPLILATSSFLTQAHSFQRVRWLLKEPGSQSVSEEFSNFMQTLAEFGAGADRKEILSLLLALQDGKIVVGPGDRIGTAISGYHALSDEARALVLEAIDDLKQNLAEIPDASLAQDWRYLCNLIDSDLQVKPAKTLEALRQILSQVLRSDNVREFQVSNAESRAALKPGLDRILSQLSSEPSKYQDYDDRPIIMDRLREHAQSSEKPIFVGLVNDNTRSGVFINSAPCASFDDSDPDILLKFLAARLYGGGGAHSMFMKTWSAGMAYSNGLRSNEFTGRLVYYAERCPDLAQTMQFVVNELKNAPRNPALAEYAVAQAFSVYRSGSRYEARGEAMAADLADDLTPDKVRRFRIAVLELRKDPGLYDKLQSMMEDTYGMVLPGYGPRADGVSDAVYFIIGPEAQFRSYEDYIHSVEGKFELFRLYPRDFWLVKPAANKTDVPQ